MSAQPEHRDKRVVIADDDHDDFYAFQIACEELKYKVLLTHVDNCDELNRQLEAVAPDILFLDIMLTQGDGCASLRDLRSNRKYDQLPIIMYTSMADVTNIEFCFKEGANLYVIKPSSFQGLREAIDRILTIDWKTTMYYPTRDSFVMTIE